MLVDAAPFALRRMPCTASKNSFTRVEVAAGTNETDSEDKKASVECAGDDAPPIGFESFVQQFDLLRQHTLQRTEGDSVRMLHVELHGSLSASTHASPSSVPTCLFRV